MIKKRVGIVFLVTGAALLIAALLLFLHNVREDELAGEASGAALSAIQNAIDEKNIPPMLDLSGDDAAETIATEETIPEPTELTVVTIDGHDYIGYIAIPNYELELPIMADWSMEKLQIAPCLQYGSPLTDDALKELMKEKGFPIARRTVAKYREQMGLPVARMRKIL